MCLFFLGQGFNSVEAWLKHWSGVSILNPTLCTVYEGLVSNTDTPDDDRGGVCVGKEQNGNSSRKHVALCFDYRERRYGIDVLCGETDRG